MPCWHTYVASTPHSLYLWLIWSLLCKHFHAANSRILKCFLCLWQSQYFFFSWRDDHGHHIWCSWFCCRRCLQHVINVHIWSYMNPITILPLSALSLTSWAEEILTQGPWYNSLIIIYPRANPSIVKHW